MSFKSAYLQNYNILFELALKYGFDFFSSLKCTSPLQVYINKYIEYIKIYYTCYAQLIY